jgi:hypothetical protein
MHSHLVLINNSCVLTKMMIYPDNVESESDSISTKNNISNHTNLDETLSDDSKLLPGNYTPAQILN